MSNLCIQVKDLRKSYFQGDRELEILKGISLTISSGETVAILGQSGSGKSTLLSLLAGLDSPQSGSISMLGTNIFSLGEKELAGFRGKNIGIVFQQFHLMPHLTTLENVMLPLEILRVSGAASTAQGVLDRVGLGTRATHFPHQLSGGECQRVAIARAFVVKPKVLLADEPSGNLDQRTGDNVMNMLFDLAVETGMTMVLVTHNEGLAERCQRRLVLTEGQIRNTNPA